MKKMLLWTMVVLTVFGLSGCAGQPEETTLPTETAIPVETSVPETTVPPTTEVRMPAGYVCLNELLEGTDIAMTAGGQTVTLSEDGLSVELSTYSKEVLRRGYIIGIMKDLPLISGDQVYIREDFFRQFFCKAGAEEVSLFHGTPFFADEVIAALEQPDASAFQTKLVAQVCLPASMGIEIPRIDPARIFSENPMSGYSDALNAELKGYGYNGDYVYGEYAVIVASCSGKAEDPSGGEQAILERMTDEQEAFFGEKQIQLTDFYDLNSWFQGSFTERTDQELIEALETCYRSKLALSLGWEYPET